MSCPTGPIYTHCQIHCSIGLSLSLSVCVTLLFCQVALTGRVIAAPQEMVCGEQRNCQCECSLAEQRVLLVQIGLSLSLTTHWSSVCHSHTHTHTRPTSGIRMRRWLNGWRLRYGRTAWWNRMSSASRETEHKEKYKSKNCSVFVTLLLHVLFITHTHTQKFYFKQPRCCHGICGPNGTAIVCSSANSSGPPSVVHEWS